MQHWFLHRKSYTGNLWSLKFKNIYVMLVSRRYPAVDYQIDLAKKKQFARVHNDAGEFRSKFYKMDELICHPNITPAGYWDLYALFVHDVSNQSTKLKYNVAEVQIKAQFS